MKSLLTLLLLLTITSLAFSQDDCEEADNFIKEGTDFLEQKKYIDAHELFKKAISKCPEKLDVIQPKIDEALKSFDEVIMKVGRADKENATSLQALEKAKEEKNKVLEEIERLKIEIENIRISKKNVEEALIKAQNQVKIEKNRANEAEREAEKMKQKAQDAQKYAERIEDKNKKILAGLYFYNDRFALVNLSGMFGFIDKTGNPVLGGYKYNHAVQFDNLGLANVSVLEAGKRVRYFIDTLDNKYKMAKNYKTLAKESNIKAFSVHVETLEELNFGKAFNREGLNVLYIYREGNGVNCEQEVFSSFLNEAKSLNYLKYLKLKNLGITKIPPEIKFLKVKYLDLSNNKIKDLPKEIKSMTGLEFLDLRGNDLRKTDKEKIKKWFYATKCTVLMD